MSGSIAYRPDVDGLRAVAVSSVILCHFGVPGFGGGYVGVDVFFVISGFLITSIVLRDIADGGYSLAKFYERRARRILPAFAAVALFTSCAALALFLPEDLLAYGKSLVASALFSTNLLFWQEGGYFAAPSELKPLLHTWSLSIEEQFYVFFPLLLSFVSRKAPRLLKGLLGILLLLSLALCVWATGRREFAFYVLPSRAWELVTGGLLAIVGRPQGLARSTSSALGLAGLAGILLPVFTFSSTTNFPGIAAALPCFGAAAVILSGPGEGPASRLLAQPTPVFVGKISYSLYLWHWPLLVFAKYYQARQLSAAETALLLLVTLGLAIASWRFVETPFRRGGPNRTRTRGVLAWALLSLAVIGATGCVLWLRDGLPGRVPAQVMAISKLHAERPRAKPGCAARIMKTGEIPTECQFGAAAARASFALWGDSHAEAVSGGVELDAAQAGRAGVLISKVGCPPLAEIDIAQGLNRNAACRAFATQAIEYLESAPALERVLLVGRWSVYIQGQLSADPGRSITQVLMGSNPLLMNRAGSATTPAERAGLFEASLRKTCERLRAKGKRVYVNDPVPEVGWDVPMTLARLTWFHPSQVVSGPTAAEYAQRNQLVLDVIRRLADEGLLTELSPQRWLCPGNGCLVREGDAVFYADGDHVSRAGSARIAPAFQPAFAD